MISERWRKIISNGVSDDDLFLAFTVVNADPLFWPFSRLLCESTRNDTMVIELSLECNVDDLEIELTKDWSLVVIFEILSFSWRLLVLISLRFRNDLRIVFLERRDLDVSVRELPIVLSSLVAADLGCGLSTTDIRASCVVR
mmetsp:Transcript_29877/g.63984  ORF Transcript_29877/g.63984 Transcript_29877/m.63984 type:complete len:142 (-) Transcript_29877:136-561(-)